MVLRWAGAMLRDAQKRFRHLKGYRTRPSLVTAIKGVVEAAAKSVSSGGGLSESSRDSTATGTSPVDVESDIASPVSHGPASRCSSSLPMVSPCSGRRSVTCVAVSAGPTITAI